MNDGDFDDPYEGYDDDFCDCDDYDVDILEGRASCFRCGRHWWLTDEQLSNEIRLFASMIECIEESESSDAGTSR